MQLDATAKINLSLRILGRRADGFHEIETLMVPISLADRLTFHASERRGVEFECDDSSLPSGGDNLVVRAAELFFAQTNASSGVRIALQKRIPHGAGLGGGSSDAATTLCALNELANQKLRPNELHELAATIGSDVPFFLGRSAAICRGRGEQIEATCLRSRLKLLLLKPEFGVPTPAAYARWQKSRDLPGIDYAPQQFGGFEFVNDLERPVFERFPFLGEMKMWLRAQDEVGAAFLSGSGSTVFGALKDGADPATLAHRARVALDPKLWTLAAETLG